LGSVELFDSGGKLDSGFAGVGVVGDDGAMNTWSEKGMLK